MLDFRSDCYRFLFLSLFYLKQDPQVEIRYKFKGDILEPFQPEALYNEVDTVFQTGAGAVSTTAWAHMKVHSVSSLATELTAPTVVYITYRDNVATT